MKKPIFSCRGVLLGVLALAFSASAYGLNYYVSVEPTLPQAGDAVSVVVLLPGVRAEGVEAPPPEPIAGLVLESVSVSPTSRMPPQADATYGVRVTYSFRAEASGEFRVPDLDIRFTGGMARVRPVSIEVLPTRGAPSIAPYVWRAPSRVMRWQCFPVELSARSSDAPPVRASSVPASRGLALEATGERTLVGMALEEGTISLPIVRTSLGTTAADALSIQSVPAPPEITASRAVGMLSARLRKPERTELAAGETVTLRVEIQGRGNLPILEPPNFTITEEGATSAPPAVTFPISRIQASLGAFEGMAGRELRFVRNEPGIYTIRTESFSYYDTGAGRVETIRFPPVRVRVHPISSDTHATSSPDPIVDRSLSAYASRPGPLGAAASAALTGRTEAALTTLQDCGNTESLHVEGLVLLRAGRRSEALASLAKAERRRRFLPGLAGSLALCEAGSGPRMRDLLPEPRIFIAGGVVFFLFGGALCAAYEWLSRRRGRKRSGLRGMAIAFASAAVLSLLLAGASLLERRTVYAVVTNEDAYSVPSEVSSRLSGDFRGQAGVVLSSSGGWALIRFRDGVSAWFRDGAYCTY